MKVGSDGIEAMKKVLAVLKGMLDYEKNLGRTSMKKLLFIIPSVLLLLAAGTLVFCKHHAERRGLACMDIDL